MSEEKKQFDCHFLIKFSDFIGTIEANTKDGAKEIARKILKDQDFLDFLRGKIINLFDDHDFEVELTDTLEIGKDVF